MGGGRALGRFRHLHESPTAPESALLLIHGGVVGALQLLRHARPANPVPDKDRDRGGLRVREDDGLRDLRGVRGARLPDAARRRVSGRQDSRVPQGHRVGGHFNGLRTVCVVPELRPQRRRVTEQQDPDVRRPGPPRPGKWLLQTEYLVIDRPVLQARRPATRRGVHDLLHGDQHRRLSDAADVWGGGRNRVVGIWVSARRSGNGGGIGDLAGDDAARIARRQGRTAPAGANEWRAAAAGGTADLRGHVRRPAGCLFAHLPERRHGLLVGGGWSGRDRVYPLALVPVPRDRATAALGDYDAPFLHRGVLDIL